MVFISFAYWTRVKLLFVDIKPILRGLKDDTPTPESKIYRIIRMQHFGQNKEDFAYQVYLFRLATKAKSGGFIL
jgi:hypothetical protein